MRRFASLWVFASAACARHEPPPAPPPASGPLSSHPSPHGAAGADPALPPGHPPLPPGHPPLPPGHAPSGAAEGAAVAGPIDVAGILLTPPPAWSAEAPASAMRRAQFRIPGGAGPAEAAVFFFGPGQGGDVESNVERWLGQFSAPGGGPATDTGRERRTAGPFAVTIVRAAGTFASGMPGGPTTPRPDHALLGLIVEAPQGPVFVKVTGPRATVEAARPDLDRLIESIAPAR